MNDAKRMCQVASALVFAAIDLPKRLTLLPTRAAQADNPVSLSAHPAARLDYARDLAKPILERWGNEPCAFHQIRR